MNIHDINFLQDNLKKKNNYDGKNGKGKTATNYNLSWLGFYFQFFKLCKYISIFSDWYDALLYHQVLI